MSRMAFGEEDILQIEVYFKSGKILPVQIGTHKMSEFKKWCLEVLTISGEGKEVVDWFAYDSGLIQMKEVEMIQVFHRES